MILELLGDALRASLEQRSSLLARQAEAFARWLAEVATPPSGAELRVPDGSSYTGLVIVDRNVAVAMLAARNGVEVRPPGSRRSPEAGPLAPRCRDTEDEPLWRSGDTPYR